MSKTKTTAPEPKPAAVPDLPSTEQLYTMKFKAPDGTIMQIRKGIKPGEIHWYRPSN